jgi:hypothetical protein
MILYPGDEMLLPWVELFCERFPLLDFKKLVSRVDCCPVSVGSSAFSSFPFECFQVYDGNDEDSNLRQTSWEVPSMVPSGYPIGEYEFFFRFYTHTDRLLFRESFTVNITALELFVPLENISASGSTFEIPFIISNQSYKRYTDINVVLMKWTCQNPLTGNDRSLVHYGIHHMNEILPFASFKLNFVVKMGEKPGMIDPREQGYYYLMAYTSLSGPTATDPSSISKLGIPLGYSSPFPVTSRSNKSKHRMVEEEKGTFSFPNSNSVHHLSNIVLVKKPTTQVNINTYEPVVFQPGPDKSDINNGLSMGSIGRSNFNLFESKRIGRSKKIFPGKYSLGINAEGNSDIDHSFTEDIKTNFVVSTVKSPQRNSIFRYQEEIPVSFFQSFCYLSNHPGLPAFLFLKNLRIELAIPSAIYMSQGDDYAGPHYRVLATVPCMGDSGTPFTFSPDYKTLDEFTESLRTNPTFDPFRQVLVSMAIKIGKGAIPPELEGQSVFILRVLADCYKYIPNLTPPISFQLELHGENVIIAETPEFIVAHNEQQLLMPDFFQFPKCQGENCPIFPSLYSTNVKNQKEEFSKNANMSEDWYIDPFDSNLPNKNCKKESTESKANSVYKFPSYIPRPSRPVLMTSFTTICSTDGKLCARLILNSPESSPKRLQKKHEAKKPKLVKEFPTNSPASQGRDEQKIMAY